MRRRIAGWREDYLAKVRGIPVRWCALAVENGAPKSNPSPCNISASKLDPDR